MCWRLAKVIFTTLLYRLSMHASSFMPAVVLQALRKCGINRMTDWQTDTGISGNKPLAVRKKVSEWSQWRGRAVRVPGPPSGVLAVLTVHYDCHSVKIETELLICSIACHSLHEKWLYFYVNKASQCWVSRLFCCATLSYISTSSSFFCLSWLVCPLHPLPWSDQTVLHSWHSCCVC